MRGLCRGSQTQADGNTRHESGQPLGPTSSIGQVGDSVRCKIPWHFCREVGKTKPASELPIYLPPRSRPDSAQA